MSSPNASDYIVQGISRNTEGTGFRWAFEHPVLQFFVPAMDQPRFVMEFALPERAFRATGPVVLTFLLNGRTFGRERYDHPGVLSYDHEVPRDWIHAEAVNQVSIEPDRVWTTSEGERYAFVMSRVGFVE
jgi:hypothetical protein